MDASLLIRKHQARRESWVEVEPGKSLCIRRPAEELFGLLRGGLTVDAVCRCVVGWRGITEADLLGAAIGAGDEVPFDADLCRETLGDRMAWVEKASEQVVKAVTAHLEAKEAAAKN